MIDDKNELMRQFVDMAVSEGRRRYSEQTGYLHYCYDRSEPPHLPIPVYDNILFALALLRSRTMDNVNEAKRILSHLLHFQSDAAEGNFPIYLHDYPFCKDRFLGVNIGVVLFQIINGFQPVLGSDLNQKLASALRKLVVYLLKTQGEKSAPYHLAVKIAALAIAVGRKFGDSEMEKQGDSMLDGLHKNPDRSAWYCPSSIGAILLGLTLVYQKLSDSPWSDFWHHLNATWHRHTSCYVGPAVREWQWAKEPQVGIYDLFMCYFQGELSKRVLIQTASHLEAACIPSKAEILDELSYPFSKQGEITQAHWQLYCDKEIAYSIIDINRLPLNPAMERGMSLLRVVWGDMDRVHSLVCQHPQTGRVEVIANGDHLEMLFFLEGEVDLEDRDKSYEIAIYLDADEGGNFLVEGHKASTFLLDEQLTLSSGNYQFQLSFALDQGDGHFQGHRRLGNRPAQVANKGSQRFEAYDWEIVLRTIRRSPTSAVRAKLHFQRCE